MLDILRSNISVIHWSYIDVYETVGQHSDRTIVSSGGRVVIACLVRPLELADLPAPDVSVQGFD